MSARVFISHRRSDGAGVAMALSHDLELLFDATQIFGVDDRPVSGEAWREALGRSPGAAPIVLLVVTPDCFGALDDQGWRRIARADDPMREELDAGLAAGAEILPLLTDGVTALPPADELPQALAGLARLPGWPLREAEWDADLGRIADDLRRLGLRPREVTLPGTMPLPIEGPETTPLPPEADSVEAAGDGGPESAGRRGLVGMATVAGLLVAGWGVWRWQQRRAADLSGIWRTRIGLRGAPTSQDGALMLVTLEQKDRKLGLASTVGIANDPQWGFVRDAWKERTGSELTQVVYRGEGEFIEAGDAAPKAASGAGAAPAASQSASAGASGTASERRADAERARRADPTLGMRRVVIAIRIAAPGKGGEKIDEGLFRGVVDITDQRIHGRLWLESEQAERVVDLRRGD